MLLFHRARVLRIGAALLLALAVAGCSSWIARPVERPRHGSAYFPLLPGAWWSYRVSDVVLERQIERKVEITHHQYVDALGGNVAVLEETHTSERDDAFFQAPIQPMGFYWHGGFLNAVYLSDRDFRPIEAMQPFRVLPEAVEPDVSWAGETEEASAVPEIIFRVDRRHELHFEKRAVRVPAGSFTGVVRVDTTAIHRGSAPTPMLPGVNFYYSDWYAPGVGLLRSETWDDPERTRLRTRVELIGFGTADRVLPVRLVGSRQRP